MPTTLDEIARIASVSRSTVSRVINESPKVSPAARERVLQVIRDTDYQPNRAARLLAGSPSRLVGLVIPQAVQSVFTDPFFPLLIEGVARTCNERGYTLVLGLVTPEMEDPYRRIARGGYLDGVIVASANEDDPFVAQLRQSALPYVMIGRPTTSDGASWVDIDNRQSASMVVQHLARQGYRRIAMITGPSKSPAGDQRRSGYLDALRQSGIEPEDRWLAPGDFSEISGHVAMRRLLSLSDRPDAVFAASDTMAIGALKAIRAAGLDVPGDIALAGFDDIPLAALVEPGLTTLRQPIAELGRTAAGILIDGLESRTPPSAQRVILPTELVVRSSCGMNRPLARQP